MLVRNAVVLSLVLGGGVLLTVGTPLPFRALTLGATCLVLAYVYAQLTKPSRRP